ncbi:hypothetical protein C8Q77DRAFT_731565 [Trametes polyzona]|nr:hypothetical protein C8Q77DRAFT_731565 [Trametes polyzona]
MATPRPVLEGLDGDIFYLVLDYLWPLRETVVLSSVSKRLRRMCMPYLFRRCRISTSQQPQIPPEAIREYVRELWIQGGYPAACAMPDFLPVFDYLPFLDTVVFNEAGGGGVPWPVVQRCLQFSNITSLSFTWSARWATPNPRRPDEPRWVAESLPCDASASGIPSRIPLTKFDYVSVVWRELRAPPRRAWSTSPCGDGCPVEAKGIAPLVLAMRETVQRLRLPLDTSPVREMCEGVWPSLTMLSFRGSYPTDMPLSAMSTLISHMPRLRELYIEVAQPPSHSRAPIFGARAPAGCERLQLRSLTIACPDPDDAIFSCVGVDLVNLSLRDWPRYYYHARARDLRLSWAAPVLTASECLRILTRMATPCLRLLEVVYIADSADDALLHYIATAYPRLERLEIHRYRAERDEDEAPYEHIVRMLSPLKTLHRLRLNLDFTCEKAMTHRVPLAERRSYPVYFDPAIIDCVKGVLQIARSVFPALQVVYVLRHDGPYSYWGPRFQESDHNWLPALTEPGSWEYMYDSEAMLENRSFSLTVSATSRGRS